jgi:hypothetical protein
MNRSPNRNRTKVNAMSNTPPLNARSKDSSRIWCKRRGPLAPSTVRNASSGRRPSTRSSSSPVRALGSFPPSSHQIDFFGTESYINSLGCWAPAYERITRIAW